MMISSIAIVNPTQGDCSWMRGGAKRPLPKICHAYPTMMKLGTVIPYLKKIQKIDKYFMLTSAFFSPEISML